MAPSTIGWEARDDWAAHHDQGQLFYSFCLADAVPDDHPVRGIAAVLDLTWVHVGIGTPNTVRPHVHILIRGKADDGRDLVISSDYSIYGLRSCAQELVTLKLGPKSERDIRSALDHEVTAERWTQLDRAIERQADESGVVDLRPSPDNQPIPRCTGLMIGRLQRLAARNFKTGKATAVRMREGSLVMMAQ